MLQGRNLTAVATTVIALGAFVSIFLAGPSIRPAGAQTIIDKWASVPAPPPPTLKQVTVDPKTTALLMLDFMSQNCGKRPACVASLPTMKKLLANARAAKAPVIYSIIANSTTADVMPDVAPLGGEPWVQAGPDKFINTDLARILKDKGIQTVIVPVDGMSAVDPYADLSTAYTFLNAPSLSAKTTLTKADMIKF